MIRPLGGMLLSTLLVFSSAACTNIDVKKVTGGDVPGIRYSLPKPFIQVTPNADGSVTVEQVYLPDLANTYAIDAAAYAASLTVDVTIEKGLLKKIEMKRDSTAVAEQVIKSAGELGSKALDVEKAKQDARQKKLDAADSKIAEAEQAVAKAELDVELALIDKESADRGTDPAAKEKARTDMLKAQVRLRAAQQTLQHLRAARTSLAMAKAEDGSPPSAPPPLEVRGPVLYAVQERVVDGRPVVSLQAVTINGNPQKAYPTVGLAPSGALEARLRITRLQKGGVEVYLIEHPSKLKTDDINGLKFFRDPAKKEPLSDQVAEKIRKAAHVVNDVIEIPSSEIDGAGVAIVEVNSATGPVPRKP